jgi:hypothetical protein
MNELQTDVAPEALAALQGRALLASIKGDHGGGKDVVADVLSALGYDVSDLGSNVEPEEIVSETKKIPAKVLIVTALMPISLRLAADRSNRIKTCRSGVTRMMSLFHERSSPERPDIVLAGFAFNRPFARRIGVETVCRTLRALLVEFHQRAAAGMAPRRRDA